MGRRRHARSTRRCLIRPRQRGPSLKRGATSTLPLLRRSLPSSTLIVVTSNVLLRTQRSQRCTRLGSSGSTALATNRDAARQYRWRFFVRLSNTREGLLAESKIVTVKASSSTEALDKLFEKYGNRILSWDFQTWGDGTYRKAVA